MWTMDLRETMSLSNQNDKKMGSTNKGTKMSEIKKKYATSSIIE